MEFSILLVICRWDVQRTRAIRNHEELLRKYNQKGGGDRLEKKKEKMTTFLPKLSEGNYVQTIGGWGKPHGNLMPSPYKHTSIKKNFFSGNN